MFLLEAAVGVSVGDRHWCFSWRQTLVCQFEAYVGGLIGGSSNARYGGS